MNDDTTRTDAWGPTDATTDSTESSTAGTTQSDPQRVGFCQDCGKPLTPETLRTVGTGVFCEPCLVTRVGSTPASPGYTTVPPYSAASQQPVPTSDPSPALAAFLGLIPGVGAMYNGQFAKGIAHLAIFAVLISLSDNVNGIFGLFAAGWIFYMVFEAYHTAVARRDGLPLPNAFGFNDIGERLGFGKSWGTVNPAKTTGAPAAYANQPPPTNPATGPTYVPPAPPVGTATDWVGYVPPSAFASQAATPEAMAAQIRARAGQNAGVEYASYAETYTGAPQTSDPAYVPMASGVAPPPARRFPSGAIWLIALGVLILMANLLPDWKLTAQWWPPILLAGFSVWLFIRRLRSGARLVCILRWPIILMVLAILLTLHAAYVPLTIGLAGAILLIAFGALLLLERTAGANSAPIAPLPYAESPFASAGTVNIPTAESPARAAWSAPDAVPHNPDETKGGQ
jgi:TM2 domain-containing membrane protein YozV